MRDSDKELTDREIILPWLIGAIVLAILLCFGFRTQGQGFNDLLWTVKKPMVAAGGGSCSTTNINYIDAGNLVVYLDIGALYTGSLFHTNSGGTVCKAYVLMVAPTGGRTVTAKIYTRSGAAGTAPGTQVGGDSDVVDTSTIPASKGLVAFTWSSNKPSISAGTPYFLVLRLSGSVGWESVVGWVETSGQVSVGQTYAESVSADGSSWSDVSGSTQARLAFALVME